MRSLEKVILKAVELEEYLSSEWKSSRELVTEKRVNIIAELCAAVRAANLKPGEQIFVLRSQDIAAPHGVNAYRILAEQFGPSADFMNECRQRQQDFVDWQEANPRLVRVPA